MQRPRIVQFNAGAKRATLLKQVQAALASAETFAAQARCPAGDDSGGEFTGPKGANCGAPGGTPKTGDFPDDHFSEPPTSRDPDYPWGAPPHPEDKSHPW